MDVRERGRSQSTLLSLNLVLHENICEAGSQEKLKAAWGKTKKP